MMLLLLIHSLAEYFVRSIDKWPPHTCTELIRLIISSFLCVEKLMKRPAKYFLSLFLFAELLSNEWLSCFVYDTKLAADQFDDGLELSASVTSNAVNQSTETQSCLCV